MPFFRPASRALSQLLRHEPTVHLSSPASLFSRHSPLAPFARAFDHPFFSSPLYTVYEVREDENNNNHNHNHNHQNHQNHNRSVKAEQQKPEEANVKTTEAQQQQQQQKSNESRLTQRHEDHHRQRSLDRRANRRARHQYANHNPLSLFSPFDSLLASPFFPQSSFQPLQMSVDLYSTPTAYQVHAAVPGVRKEDIKLTVEDGVLTIEAERREERRRPSKATTTAAPATASTSSATSDSATTSSASTNNGATGAEAHQAEQKAVEVEVKADGVDTNSAETKAQEQEPQLQQHEQEEEDDELSVHHVESHYGRVQRSLQLPEDVDENGLTARYEDGVLKIELPRIEEKKQQVKQINIQ